MPQACCAQFQGLKKLWVKMGAIKKAEKSILSAQLETARREPVALYQPYLPYLSISGHIPRSPEIWTLDCHISSTLDCHVHLGPYLLHACASLRFRLLRQGQGNCEGRFEGRTRNKTKNKTSKRLSKKQRT